MDNLGGVGMKDVFGEYERSFAASGEPIAVNFRELVPELRSKERYTHLIHSYPAKLLCNIPYYFLKTEYFCPRDGIVLDPFCGTGTVLLEAVLSGREALGADANPLAVLISEVKTTYIAKEVLLETLSTIIKRAERCREVYVVDSLIKGWFSDSTINQLGHLQHAIEKVKNNSQRKFLLLCLSNLVRKVSYADSTISVPVHLNPFRFAKGSDRRAAASFKLETLKAVDVYDKYENICRLNIERVASLEPFKGSLKSKVISNDARRLTRTLMSDELIKDESIDLILTSPPYAGAQKYIRASRLNLYWLGEKDSEAIRILNEQTIGREDFHKKDYSQKIETGIDAADTILRKLYSEGKYERACIVGTYLNEMKKALDESYRVLKIGGYIILVIGNNKVCGLSFDTQDYLTTYLQQKGMKLKFKLIDDIKSYGMMTKRNKTADKISSEWILVLQK